MRLTTPVRVATFVFAIALLAYACGDSTSPVAGIPASVTLVPSTLTLKAIGNREDLTATVYDAEGTVIDTTVLFEPSDPAIITVSATGTVTATGVGVASVTVSLGDLTKTSTVNVFPVGTDIDKVSGDLQSAVVGIVLPAPLVVQCSWLTSSPAPCNGRPLWYGVTWSLLRWVNDHFGPAYTGGERGIQKAIVDNILVGLRNLENVVGEPIETLLAEWAATLYVDDRGVTGLPARLDFPSWNLGHLRGRNASALVEVGPDSGGVACKSSSSESTDAQTRELAAVLCDVGRVQWQRWGKPDGSHGPGNADR